MKRLFPRAVIKGESGGLVEILSNDEFRYLNRKGFDATQRGVNLITDWDYEKSGWWLVSDSIITAVLNKYGDEEG